MLALVLATAMMGAEDVRPLSYWEQYLLKVAEATRDGKHIVVFVEQNDGPGESRPYYLRKDGIVTLVVRSFPDIKGRAIMVGRWNGSYHERIDLPITATLAEIKDALYPKKQEESVPVRRQWAPTNC